MDRKALPDPKNKHKNSGQLRHDDLRRLREAATVEIRKTKREESAKRRYVAQGKTTVNMK
jgi:hypothetical protein